MISHRIEQDDDRALAKQLSALRRRKGIKSSFSIALIRTESRWIPASTSTNQGSEKGDLVYQEDDRALSGQLSTLRGRRGVDAKKRVMVVVGGNKMVTSARQLNPCTLNLCDHFFCWQQNGLPLPANVAHVRQSRPDSGLGFQGTGLLIFKGSLPVVSLSPPCCVHPE